jgi:hypothetical protein
MSDTSKQEPPLPEGLNPPDIEKLRLERLLESAGSTVIEAVLAPELHRLVAAHVDGLVRDGAQRLWLGQNLSVGTPISDAIAESLSAHHRRAVKLAKSTGRVERIQVFQLAVLKLFLAAVDSGIRALRDELGESRGRSLEQTSGQGLEIHNRAVRLARNAPHLRYIVVRDLLEQYLLIDRRAMLPARNSVLGRPWPVPEVMVTDPILQLAGVGAARDFLDHYPVCLYERDAAVRAGRCVFEALGDLVPAFASNPAGANEVLREGGSARASHGPVLGLLETEQRVREFCGIAELRDGADSWLDVPEHAAALLGGDGSASSARRLVMRASEGERRLRRLERSLQREGLRQAVVAAYETEALMPLLGAEGSELVVYEHLAGRLGRKEAIRRLAAIDGVSNADTLMDRVLVRRKALPGRPASDRAAMMRRFAVDFLRLRRDLKLAWRCFVALEQIRLVDYLGAAEQADDGAPLLVFHIDRPAVPAEDIVGIATVRVELRGLHALATRMQRLRIDVTAQLSERLFEEATREAARVGARKLVANGSELMFAIHQRENADADALAVARACLLARGLIEVVDRVNKAAARQDLPPIEASVVITYADEPPIRLYDNVRNVTLSSAIERARSLTRNDPVLRRQHPPPDGYGLTVAMPVAAVESAAAADAAALVRDNANAIELDGAAYAELRREIRLQRVEMRERRHGRQILVHVGECADHTGLTGQIMLRERRVRFWAGGKLVEARDDTQHYFEVIWQPKMRNLVLDYQQRAGDGDPPTE